MNTLTQAPHLPISDRIRDRVRQGGLQQSQVDDFQTFLAEVDQRLLHIFWDGLNDDRLQQIYV